MYVVFYWLDYSLIRWNHTRPFEIPLPHPATTAGEVIAADAPLKQPIPIS